MSSQITDQKKGPQALYTEKSTLGPDSAEDTLQTIPVHIAVLDADSVILRVNKAWTSFAVQNGCPPETTFVGVNYLAVCDGVSDVDSALAKEFAVGIRSVISREREYFSLGYGCRTPTGEQQWFLGYVTPQGALHTVVAHVNITAQKLVETRIRDLNQELETLVTARTAELGTAAEALIVEASERRCLELKVIKISEREQARIGQDLHDVTCQDLTRIVLLAEIAKNELKQEKTDAAELLTEISLIARQSADETRRLVANLFPAKIEHHGLEWALRKLTTDISSSSKANCSFIMRSKVDFTADAALQLFRIAQEATNNALRHGRAKNVTIEISESNGTVRMVIQDDGKGIVADVMTAGFGLHIMQYRAKTLGGLLEAGPSEKRGTTIVCSFPNHASPQCTPPPP